MLFSLFYIFLIFNSGNCSEFDKFLLRATNDNDLEIVNFLLQNGADVNYADENGVVALHVAAQRGFVNVLKALLFNSGGKIKMNAADDVGRTAFHYAAKGGHAKIIEILSFTDLRSYSNVSEDEYGMTSLEMAIEEGHEEAAFALIKILSYELSEKCATELRLAAQFGRKSVLLALLESGCNLEEKDAENRERTVLLNAMEFADPNGEEADANHVTGSYNSADIVRALILSGADINAVDGDGKSAVNLALKYKNYDALQVVRSETNVRSSRILAKGLQPPLHFEITKRNPNLKSVRKMITPEEIDDRDHLNRTAAHMAVELDNADIIAELILAGCDLTLKEARGNTVLHLVKSANVACILLKSEPDLTDIPDELGHLPLHTAVLDQCEDLVAVLAPVTAGIAVARNKHKYTVLEAAAELGNVAIVVCLLKNGAADNFGEYPFQAPLHNAAFVGDMETTKLLTDYGFEITARNEAGLLPAHCAVCSGNLDVIRYLMRGVREDETDNYGSSLLHYASMGAEKNGAVIKTLVEEFEVPLGSETFDGRTALHVTVMKGFVENIKMLIRCGIDVKATTPDGETALQYAIMHYKEESVMEIISDMVHADRGVLFVENSEGLTPADRILEYNLESSVRKISAMELTPADISSDYLAQFLRILSKSFAQFVDTLDTMVSFEEYIHRGVQCFKTDVELEEESSLEKNIANGLGIFYSFAAAVYPNLVSIEAPMAGTEEYDEKRRGCCNAIAAFEILNDKIVYANELRCMLVDSFTSEKGREKLEGTYAHFLPVELLDDALIGVANNGDVLGRMELVANSLMLTFDGRVDFELHRPFLLGKMARLSEVIIPK